MIDSKGVGETDRQTKRSRHKTKRRETEDEIWRKAETENERMG